jgi:hypothetical protein
MNEQTIRRNLSELEAGIRMSLENQLHLPALVLLYSAIDICSWLASDDPNAKVGERYMRWVDQYLLKAKPLHSTSTDLYAARCGLLHTLTPDSRLSDTGKARLLCYVWGDRDPEALHKTNVKLGMDDRYVAVGVADLFEAWKGAVGGFMQEMAQDPDYAVRVYERAGRYFDSDSAERIDRAIRLTGNA